jgi:2-oxoisovalerate dehydrogenase E2 component (dihydrolipoyl transacylase)
MAVRDFLLPDLGEGLEDAEVAKWHVAEGDRVELNQMLVEVNTAKALVDIPAPWEGVIEKLHAAEGDVVKVGSPLVSIRVEAEAEVDTAEASKPKRQAVLVGYGVAEEEASPSRRKRKPVDDGGNGAGGASKATPPVRKLAKELGVDLADIRGSGPDGRVTRADVEAAAGSAPQARGPRPTPAPPTPQSLPVHAGDERIPVRGVRRLVAERMARSASEIPHVTTFLSIDATWIEALRAELEAEVGHRVTALPLIVRAFVEVVKEFRSLNASFDAAASEIVLRGEVNVGIATETERGLLVPVVRNADALGITALAEEIGRLVEAARSGQASPEELTGGTVTVTNVGSFGAESGTPIINHPESCILAVGVIEPRALVVEGVVEARPATTLSLSFDHRVLDGAEAGRAMKALGALLESPFRLGALPR